MSKNRSRAYENIASEQAALPTVHYGLARIPYCKTNRCWMLPSGPAQINRKLKTYDEAMRFAKLMNGMLTGVPMNHKH